RKGQEAVKLAERTPQFEHVGAIDHTYDQKKLSDVMPVESDAFIYTDIHAFFTETQPDVLIDLTTPEIGKVLTKSALEHGVRPVVGTTGFSEA
ncbi:4-hydroxy-tetrahydrodipicolinate reductase, partial [Bacillus subtilis]|nr:4-hydroxy-tetrahydrodipicolinate reductase [Bacillus subtilis]